jgi:cysteine synthase A
MIHDSVLTTIGRTPLVRLARLFPDSPVYVKCERANPGGSIKDRIALAMVTDALADSRLAPGQAVVEPTSGNTGIGLAMVCAVLGHPLTLVMPSSMSVERRRLMLAYGARLELTDAPLGMKGAIRRAEEIVESQGAWMPMQFENDSNVEVHRATTARELLEELDDLDHYVAAVGTGGHLSGVAEVLREHYAGLRVHAVEPSASAVISGGEHSPHRLQGIGAGFVPANLHPVYDDVLTVDEADAFEWSRRSALEEGLLVGPSSGAALAAAARVEAGHKGESILLFNYDTGERYLSVDGFLPPE